MDMERALDALRAARQQLYAAERSLLIDPAPPEEVPAAIVQLKPSADPRWGGMLLRVKRMRSGTVEGYLLRPHRGGNREAWYRAKLCEVTSVAVSIPYPESAWGFENWYRGDNPREYDGRTTAVRVRYEFCSNVWGNAALFPESSQFIRYRRSR